MSRETEHSQTATFEAAGQRLVLEGTSGPSKLPQLVAEGSHATQTLVVGGQSLSLKETSGVSKYPQRSAEGKPSHQTRQLRTSVTESPGIYPKSTK
jgi:hypothetical protein